ncbi:hypothetical protein GJ496_009278 [Pomphorhynchus laevis]|nr:hypothetical protein GJ496_009278 [Pomphorhynchus laevis]
MRIIILICIFIVTIFASRLKAQNKDICNLPPVKGQIQCLAAIKKYTYNASLKECVKYTYGGCHGTANLFQTYDECKRACMNH